MSSARSPEMSPQLRVSLVRFSAQRFCVHAVGTLRICREAGAGDLEIVANREVQRIYCIDYGDIGGRITGLLVATMSNPIDDVDGMPSSVPLCSNSILSPIRLWPCAVA